MDRVEILRDLRLGKFDVLIGINLLREGLDLPEVSLVAILDADKEGFLRSETSLTQTAGRAARNSNGLVIMYADKITKSMARTIDETSRRREKQIAYNTKHGITPTTILKTKEEIYEQTAVADGNRKLTNMQGYDEEAQNPAIAADPVIQYMTKEQMEKSLDKTRKDMMRAAKEMDFVLAAQLRDEMYALQAVFDEKFGGVKK
jgi:excinuclease ABC subunit B